MKVAGVAEWPVPNNKKEVQSFLGFINFYRRFIQDFSHHAHPLFNLTKNDVKWLWSQEEQSAFNTLKGLVTSAPILTSPDNSRPFRIEAVMRFVRSMHKQTKNNKQCDKGALYVLVLITKSSWAEMRQIK